MHTLAHQPTTRTRLSRRLRLCYRTPSACSTVGSTLIGLVGQTKHRAHIHAYHMATNAYITLRYRTQMHIPETTRSPRFLGTAEHSPATMSQLTYRASTQTTDQPIKSGPHLLPPTCAGKRLSVSMKMRNTCAANIHMSRNISQGICDSNT